MGSSVRRKITLVLLLYLNKKRKKSKDLCRFRELKEVAKKNLKIIAKTSQVKLVKYLSFA